LFALFLGHQEMTNTEFYTTNLSKAQGMVPETLELLELWEPGMSVADLKARVRAVGALGRATQVRVDDLVGRGFAQRYLIDDGRPALWLKRILNSRISRSVLRQLMLLYAVRANLILRDFITDVYWMKCRSHAGEVTKEDARDFIERAVSRGRLENRWSDSIVERVSRYLLGTFVDFELIADNRYGHRQIRPLFPLIETVVYLAHDLHFKSTDDAEIPTNPDWQVFGLSSTEVIAQLEKVSAQGHFFLQHSGAILRIEWKYNDMEGMIDALAR